MRNTNLSGLDDLLVESYEALDKSPLQFSLLSISVFLIRLSWIIRGFIYFNRHLFGFMKENSVTKKQELNIIWLISHFRRVSTSWREIFPQLQKFVWGLYVLPCRANCLWLMSEFSFETLGKCFLLIYIYDIFCIEDVGE